MSDASNIIGRLTVNSKEILEVDADPSSAPGIPAPVGSLAAYDSGVIGRLYMKRGVADDAWTPFDTQEGDDWNLDGNDLTGGTALTPNEYMGSNNDYDVAMKRNNIEIMRMVQQGLLIGLSTAIPSFAGKLQVASAANGGILSTLSAPNNGAGARVVRVTRQFKIQTVDGAETALATLTIPDTSRVQATCYVGGRQHGGAGGAVGDGADYIRTFSAKRDGAAAILNGSQTDFTEEDAGGFNCRINNNVNDIEVLVTGDADRNMAWSCHMEYSVFVD